MSGHKLYIIFYTSLKVDIFDLYGIYCKIYNILNINFYQVSLLHNWHMIILKLKKSHD
jgi:hypothetical protein